MDGLGWTEEVSETAGGGTVIRPCGVAQIVKTKSLEVCLDGGGEPDSLAPIGVAQFGVVGSDEDGIVVVGARESPASLGEDAGLWPIRQRHS